MPANLATKACNASAIPKTFKNCAVGHQVTLPLFGQSLVNKKKTKTN